MGPSVPPAVSYSKRGQALSVESDHREEWDGARRLELSTSKGDVPASPLGVQERKKATSAVGVRTWTHKPPLHWRACTRFSLIQPWSSVSSAFRTTLVVVLTVYCALQILTSADLCLWIGCAKSELSNSSCKCFLESGAGCRRRAHTA